MLVCVLPHNFFPGKHVKQAKEMARAQERYRKINGRGKDKRRKCELIGMGMGIKKDRDH